MRVLSCKTLKVVSHERHCGKAACQEFGGVEVEVCSHPCVKEDFDARVRLCVVIHPFIGRNSHTMAGAVSLTVPLISFSGLRTSLGSKSKDVVISRACLRVVSLASVRLMPVRVRVKSVTRRYCSIRLIALLTAGLSSIWPQSHFESFKNNEINQSH